MNRIYADILVDGRRFDEAIEQYKKTLELDPTFPTSQFFLGRAYEGKGMYDEAVEHYSASAKLTNVPEPVLNKMNDAYAKSGWQAYLQTSLDNLVLEAQQRRFPAFVVASFYARLGRKDEAIEWLEKGFEERDFRMTTLSVSFEFDSLGSDPRFKDLMRRMGLPE
jgi:serine/threonine-protein kinase